MEKQSHFSKILAVLRNRTLHEVVVVLMIIGVVVGYSEYRRQFLVKEIGTIKQEQKIDREGLESRIAILENDLSLSKQEITTTVQTLLAQLQGEQSKSETFQAEISKIAGTVGTLDKLSKTDSELLQKYSKVYFLNEHYVPVSLSLIDLKYLSKEKKELKIHSNILPYLNLLLAAAETEQLHLQVASAFRSFGEQSQLKASYRFSYGAGTANQFSADQGYSEHQLGTTVDLVTPETAITFAGFDTTVEYSWLVGNAHKYGFVLSYPKNNGYYQYEPWHWRFVGVALATRLHNEAKYFYDFDQREINTYLVNIFD